MGDELQMWDYVGFKIREAAGGFSINKGPRHMHMPVAGAFKGLKISTQRDHIYNIPLEMTDVLKQAHSEAEKAGMNPSLITRSTGGQTCHSGINVPVAQMMKVYEYADKDF